jgi:membrane-bound metal-dependent hydrolase YbcI (DUF457 family)
MNGTEHFAVGAITTGLAFWGAQTVGLQVETEIIVAGVLVAGLGSLAPDIDHSRSTISRGLPFALLERGLGLFMLVAILVGIPAIMGDFRGASQIFKSLSSKPLIRWALILTLTAVALKATSAIISGLSGHRGATHSLVFAAGATLIAVGACMYLNIAWWYGLLFGWGWLLHLLTDAPSEMGLPSLLWPFARGR